MTNPAWWAAPLKGHRTQLMQLAAASSKVAHAGTAECPSTHCKAPSTNFRPTVLVFMLLGAATGSAGRQGTTYAVMRVE